MSEHAVTEKTKFRVDKVLKYAVGDEFIRTDRIERVDGKDLYHVWYAVKGVADVPVYKEILITGEALRCGYCG